ncbi:MAG TPA: Hpt domain-containing protein [Paracoccus sp. (in: a-proteobacteria)]|nr:Hpt domain-containing protein [Paracoccus sp. (in: a-proteobacteria)]
MIDWKRLCQLHEEVGPDEFRPILELFRDEIESVVLRLDPNDGAALEAQLHFLRGGACNLGLREFAALCQAGEALASTGRAREADLGALTEAWARARRMLMHDLEKLALRGAGDAV